MLPTPSLYAARPEIAVDGVDDPALGEHLLSLVVAETDDGLARCEAVFTNWGRRDGGVGYLFSDRRRLDFGTPILLRMGAGDRAGEVFDGRISGLEPHFPQDRPPELVVLAEDGLQKLRMTRRTRSFEDVTDADVIRTVASQHGLRAELEVDGPRHRVVAQLNLSDLAFVRERARAVDAEVWVTGDVLHAQARARRDAGTVTLTYGQDLREASVLADLAHQRTSVAVGGWDVAAKEAIEQEATVRAVTPELDGDVAGVSILERALGPRPERLVGTMPSTTAEAQAMADAVMRRTARRFVTGRIVAEGDGRLRVGGNVELRALGEGFSGTYHVHEVRQVFDGTSGHVTHLGVQRAGLATGGR